MEGVVYGHYRVIFPNIGQIHENFQKLRTKRGDIYRGIEFFLSSIISPEIETTYEERGSLKTMWQMEDFSPSYLHRGLSFKNQAYHVYIESDTEYGYEPGTAQTFPGYILLSPFRYTRHDKLNYKHILFKDRLWDKYQWNVF